MNTEEETGAEKRQILNLLQSIREQSNGLLSVLWSREELLENKEFFIATQQKIKNMIDQIAKNLYWYQKTGWKKFVQNPQMLAIQEVEAEIVKEKERFTEWLQDMGEISDFYLQFPQQLDERKLAETLSSHLACELAEIYALDVGCRHGNWLRKLSDWGALSERLIGVDFNDAIFDKAKQLSSALIEFSKAYPDEIPVPDTKFDLILIFGVLMHILDEPLQKRIGERLLNVLSSDGVIVTLNFTKKAVSKLEPYLAFSTRGIERNELMSIFPNCEIFDEELPQPGYSLAVIRRKF